MEITEVIKKAYAAGASDVHLLFGRPVMLRINGTMSAYGTEVLQQMDLNELMTICLSQDQKKTLEETGEIDAAVSIPGLSRIFVNVYRQQGMYAAAIRLLAPDVPRLSPAASSNLPKAGGPRHRLHLVLLRMGFTYALSVAREAVVSYTALPPLPDEPHPAVYFCCTILRVASTGRYPASCPVKPGLSSPAVTAAAIICPAYFYHTLYMKHASADKFS